MNIPKQLVDCKFCRVRKQSKAPFEMDWVNKPYSYEEISKIENENYGVLCGHNNLAVIDCDKEELVLVVEQLLPPTFTIQTGGGGKHFYYFIPELKKKIILNAEKEHLGEIQFSGQQVVGPGSIHPNGKEYKALNNEMIATITLAEIEDVLGEFMEKETATIKPGIETPEDYKELVQSIVEKWKEGNRNELALSVAGYLRKEKRLGIDKAKEIIVHVCNVCEDKEVAMRMRSVEETYKKDESKIKGYKGLEEFGIKEKPAKKNKKKNYTSGFVDEENQIIVEQVYSPKHDKSMFWEYNNKTGELKHSDTINYMGDIYYPNEGDELKERAVILPYQPEDYGTDEELDKEIDDFIKKWLDVPEKVRLFGRWNAKRSFVYDKFHTINYLRAQGDTGLGKTRFLDTFGYIHYKPLFTTGATTPAPLFRIIKKWKGTLVMDEADLKFSDESADIIKIINQGYEKGKFIMRCDQNDASKIDFFDPFCPKILATRRSFQDKATESRCITHVMEITKRKDILVNLNEEFFEETRKISNKLLMWRFKNYFNIDMNKTYDMGDLEPRVKQLVSSYVAIFSNDKTAMEEFKEYIQTYQEDLIEERKGSFEGSVVESVYNLLKRGIKDISNKMIVESGNLVNTRTGKPLTPRGVSSMLKSLGFKKAISTRIPGETNVRRCIPLEKDHLFGLFKRYGLDCYDVTVVTVVTGISDDNNIVKNTEKTAQTELGVPNRYNRNNRNTVTENDDENEEEIEKVDMSISEKFEERYNKEKEEIEDSDKAGGIQ